MKSKILVVDDSYYMRVVLRNLLLDAGHEVIGEASSGEEAMKIIGEKSPNLVMLDLILPDTTGLEILKAIKKNNPELKVIMVSAVGQDMVVKEALHNGALAYIIKPFKEEKVLEVVESVTGN